MIGASILKSDLLPPPRGALSTSVKRALRRGLRRAAEGLRNAVSALRFEVSHESLLRATTLTLIALLAAGLRLLPLRWGAYLSEFDPYWHYHVARYVSEHGFAAFFTWRDDMVWYPWGRNVAKTTYPGVAFTAAGLYMLLRWLGVPIDLYTLCVYFPVLMTAITCLAMYYLGREVAGPKVGLLSAFFLAVNQAHIQRTSLGFFDDETVGILLIVLFSTFLLRAVDEKRSEGEHIAYSVLAGLSLGFLCATWGASRYPFAIASAFMVVLVLLRRYRPRLLSAYSITFGLALFIAIHVPKLGLRFLWESTVMPVVVAFIILAVAELVRHVEKTSHKAVVAVACLALLAAALYLAMYFKLVKPVGKKFLSVVNPLMRKELPLFESVAEHKPNTWAIMFYELGAGILFALLGIFFAVREPTDKSIFLTIFGLTAIYSAASLVRLGVLMAVPVGVLWAFALERLARPLMQVMKEAEEAFVRKEAHAGKGLAGFTFPLIFMLTFLSVAGAVQAAESPVTIASASLPMKDSYPDWLEALNWIKTNLPPDAVIAAWWDYGYWIRVIANRTTLADNGTINMTQIQLIARMFLSNETEAVKILRKLGATHVLIFITFRSPMGDDAGYGDENKWHWMARIAADRWPEFKEEEFGKYEHGRWEWSDRGKQTVIYKLMQYVKSETLGEVRVPKPELEHFELVFVSHGRARGGIYARVAIFQVLY